MHETAHELGRIAVTNVGYLWLIPLFPLIGATVNALIGWKLQQLFGRKIVHRIAVAAMLAAFGVALVAFAQMLRLPSEERFLQDTLWNLMTAGRMTVDFGFALDPLSMMMVLVITGIGSLIHVFSIGYMHDEPSYWRFFSYLNLFVFAMLLLVMGDNFAVMFFGWEGVGLASYLLIAFWYTDPEKAKAGMKAFVANRFGDFGFLAGLFLLFWALGGAWTPRTGSGLRNNDYQPLAELNATAGAATAAQSQALAPSVHDVKVGPTMNFRELRDQVVIESTGVKEHLAGSSIWGVSLLTLVCVLLFVGAMGKSAQIPLYVWLPDAMAGPTPVSALIHAATMVTAGVYMVARLNFLFALSASAMGWVALIGAATAIFAASIGFFQYDIKKVLAYSTVSQLGFMFIGVGVGAYWAGAYHLLTHAFFKATLFLGSGSVILGCHHEQDMRKMGGLKKHMPITRWTYLAACWAIAGFPWMNGFYSKDEILYKAFTSGHLALFGVPTPWLGPAIFVVGIIAATGTSFYMFRSYYMTFTGEYRGNAGHHDEHNEDPHSAGAAAMSHLAVAVHASDGAVHADGHAHGHAAPAHGHAVHAPAAAAATAHAPAHDDHGHHGGTPHESPWTVTLVLSLLALGSFFTLFLGIPMAWTGKAPILEHWLAPALTAQEGVPFQHLSHSTEYMFQAIGVLAGAVGWFFAMLLFKDARSEVPARLREKFLGVWTVVYNKYYVDELYAVAVLKPSMKVAQAASWFDSNVIDRLVLLAGTVTRVVANIDGAIDKYLVDGAVNAVASVTQECGRYLRSLQTGKVQTYLYGALGGALVVVLLNFLIS
ncbi:proton-conducting transporter membrane subunit [Anaeromyxobacter dehalogenans]|uniref:NADH dehydrogenase subunit L n=1 Tax=Anaeromyxobacter dehalogenans (strain 2CP-C) TaxID=290397 RepID=Q2IL20_ANADE|nr:proton-conducting transporter membrane subunit [Anaeromyxobacter dehalogenans]ABC82349.1 NADH dehydrogenase subunit L [Anaeromyxobacter dehalogenans 2CP-C]